MTTVFYAFRDSPQRRRALAAPPGAPERYVLYGLDELRSRGFEVRHNLDAARPPSWARSADRVLKAAISRAGGYGGDFASVLPHLRDASRADVVVSTVDTVGIPLALAHRAGFLRAPLLYLAIGLPERLARLRGDRVRRVYAEALSRTAAIVAYSEPEADELRRFVASHGLEASVEFVPFGVDTRALRPPVEEPVEDVVSVGADPSRDFDLLLGVAASMPEVSFRLVVTADRSRAIGTTPANVAVEADLPFEEMLRRLERARVVALPVRENSYSGATTVLLQAMALGKPVVVSRTRAIATGYELVDGENCRLVPPGDETLLGRALAHVLDDGLHARALGSSARTTAERWLTWDRYVERLERLVRDASGARADARSRRA